MQRRACNVLKELGRNRSLFRRACAQVYLFCRNEGQGYVACGRLIYRGHDPDRIPIRFVWELEEFDKLKSQGDAAPFKELVDHCNAMFA